MVKTVFSYLRMIKFSHSVFALPFAFTAALMAADGLPSLWKMFWIRGGDGLGAKRGHGTQQICRQED
jgi:hypothetical protein